MGILLPCTPVHTMQPQSVQVHQTVLWLPSPLQGMGLCTALLERKYVMHCFFSESKENVIYAYFRQICLCVSVLVWGCRGLVVKASDFHARGHGFDSRLGQAAE